jgi:lipoprotein-anchoring transpeptidase ErfK/SrfK
LRSATHLVPGAVYDVTAAARSPQGAPRRLTTTFRVAEVPASQRLTLTVSPGPGGQVGVGTPVRVRFDQPVTDRTAVERALTVRSSTPVDGAWLWMSSHEVHFRPRTYWPAHTTVEVRLGLGGVHAGPHLWGGRTYTRRFAIGDAHVTRVDAAAHTMTVTVNGATWGRWPTSLGMPAFATRNGTYAVLERSPTVAMTSCSAHIQCTKGAPNYYDLSVKWDVRLTNSGTFIHAAPWSASAQGAANVSHGCINLTEARAKAFYDLTLPGDVVDVVNSGRAATDLVRSQDPGMADWNLPWSTYLGAGDAVTTGSLVQ